MKLGYKLPAPPLDPQRRLQGTLWCELALSSQQPIATRHIDLARALVPCPNEETWLAWKVLRDPAYQDVYRRFGTLQALVDAGFIDDQLAVPVEQLPCWDLGLVTPFDKLLDRAQALPTDAPGVVLLTTGSFSPVHQGHLAMMEAARAEVEARGGRVVGGYLSPSHDHYVSFKQGGAAARDIASRLAICQEAVADSDWLMVDPWEGRYAPTALNFTDVIRRLEAYLAKVVPSRHLEVVYVFGSDNCGFLAAGAQATASSQLPFPKYLCVSRGKRSEALTRRLAQLAVADVPVWCSERMTEHREASSTAIRAGELSALVPRSRGRVVGAPEPTEPQRYLVRDDLAWATRSWPDSARRATSDFTKGLCQALSKAFSGSRREPVRIVRLSHEAQRLEAARQVELQSVPVVSLDAMTPAPHQLAVSRRFGVASGQVFSRHLVARPGHPSLPDQVAAIPAGPVFLLEDDIATGTTVRKAKELLSGRCEVVGMALLTEHSLTEMGEDLDFLDVVDARDFLLGAKDGGLVVRLPDGSLGRAPYMLPWVSTVFRAKLPCDAELAFSRDLWQLNAQWLREHAREQRVQDVPEAARKLLVTEGFQECRPLWQVAEHYALALRDVF